MEPIKTFIYFNLHKKCFSIKALEGANKGRVIAHRDALVLYHAKFKVSEAGRQRVLKEQRKNVHAGVVGIWYDEVDADKTLRVRDTTAVTYNPYKYDSFVTVDDQQRIDEAWCVVLKDKRITAVSF